MSGLTDAARLAIPVAQEALLTRASLYGPAETVVLALSEAQLLQTPETAAELERLRSAAAAIEENRRRADARAAEGPSEMVFAQQCPAGQHRPWFADSPAAAPCPWCRIAEVESSEAQQRAETTGHLRHAAELLKALRAANARTIGLETAAVLVAEYRVPLTSGRWLSVRREHDSDRWAILTSHQAQDERLVWVDGRWQYLAMVADAHLWAHPTAEDALRLAGELGAEIDTAAEHGVYLSCGADLGRAEAPFTCQRRAAHNSGCSPDRDWVEAGERP